MTSDPAAQLAYYLWRFPLTSETFIQREIASLGADGRPPLLFADAPGEDEQLTPAAQALARETHYLLPISPTQVAGALAGLVHRPGRLWQALFLALRVPLPEAPGLAARLRIFAKAAVLARHLAAAGVRRGHCPWADTNAFVLRLAALLLDLPYSVQARAHDIHRGDRLPGLAERLAGARLIVTNCDYNRRHLQALCGPRLSARLVVNRNGVDPGRFPALPLRTHPVPLRLLCVARLIEQKGLAHLLLACARLLREGRELACDIIGAPELPLYAGCWQRLQTLHRRLGLGERVRFLGPQPFDAVLAAHARADLFVLPCVIARDGSRDITPNALIEAMASGLPVISTRMEPIPEIVDHDHDGLLVEPGDSRALSRAVAALADDYPRRLRLGRAARAKVAERFDIHRNGARLTRLLCT